MTITTEEIIKFCTKKLDDAMVDLEDVDKYDNYAAYTYYEGCVDSYQSILTFLKEGEKR